MVDGYDIVGGEGPMAPTRCGSVSVADLLQYMKRENLEIADVKKLCTRTGGFVSHTGISDALELTKRAQAGDKYAEMLWNTMIYQIEKCIGSMAAVLHGKVDGILLGGGMVYNEDLVRQITESCSFIAPVYAYPGEFEMEAMAAGAIRVLNRGRRTQRVYRKTCVGRIPVAGVRNGCKKRESASICWHWHLGSHLCLRSGRCSLRISA